MKGNKKVVITLMAVALLVLPTAMIASAAEPGDPDTTITITGATLECGATATSQILVTIVNQATDPEEVRGVEVHLTFDPALLQVVDADGDSGNGVQLAVESDLFDGDLRIGQNLADNGAGTIVFAVAQSDGTPVFNATNKAIATITWECAGECPEAQVETEVTVAGNTLMSDPDGYPVAADCAVNGTITIPACVAAGCIEGYVSPQGRYDFSGIRVIAGAYEAYTDASGYFKLEGVEAGTYEVMAEMYGYLDAVASGVEVVAGDECTFLGTTTLWGGNVAPQPDPDAVIDILDVSYLGANFGTTETTADVNGDGVVNILDLTVAAANFGMTGPTPWAE
jgi:metal-sulfur cluster biosynthetic enzyme